MVQKLISFNLDFINQYEIIIKIRAEFIFSIKEILKSSKSWFRNLTYI